jgi:hypothetical protein
LLELRFGGGLVSFELTEYFPQTVKAPGGDVVEGAVQDETFGAGLSVLRNIDSDARARLPR